jgi:putative transposase
MIYGFMDAQKATFPIRLMCRRLGVSPAGFYEWQGRRQQPSARSRADTELTVTIREIHHLSDGTYGSPRVWADLRLGSGVRVSRKRVERLMRQAGLQGISRRKKGCTRRNPADVPAEDLVRRQFHPEGPDRLWVADITEHPTRQGKVYAAVVIDAWSRRVVGLSIADHLRAELVIDALDAAIWRRRPKPDQTIHHSDHGCQYTAWAFGQRLRKAGLLGSTGTVGDALDNAVAESFFASLQTELLDRRTWDSRHQLAQAIFAWVEAWYNPRRRHSALGYLSPIQYEAHHTTLQKVA